MDLKRAAMEAIGLKFRKTSRGSVPAGPGGSNGQIGSPLIGFQQWSMEKALKDGYEINEAVHACINAIARHASSVPWRASVFESVEAKARFEYELKAIPASQRNDFIKDVHKKRRTLSPERKSHLIRQPNSPAERLIENPNPFMTRKTVITRMVQHRYLAGNALNLVIRSKAEGIRGYNTPVELWPLYPQYVEVIKEKQYPTAYKYNPEGRYGKGGDTYRAEDVLHIMYVAPNDSVWGLSPLMAAARSVDTDTQAAIFQLNSMHNRGVTDALITPTGENSLNPKDYNRAKKEFRENNTGAAKARAPWFINTALQVQKMNLTAAEVDYVKTRGLNRQNIATIFNVFLPVISVLEGVGLSNIEEIMKHHWLQTVIPELDVMQGEFNRTLAPAFGEETFYWYDVSNVEALNVNLMERMRMQKVLHTQGIPMTTLNDRFDLGFDLDDVPGADQGMVPAGVTLIETLLNGGEATNEPGNPNTPAEGGDPGEPGDDTEPNEGDPKPDSSVDGVSEGDEGKSILEDLFGDERDLDIHGGRRRWQLTEMLGLLTNSDADYDGTTFEDGPDFYSYEITHLPNQIRDLAADEKSGVAVHEISIVSDTWLLRFYHGQQTEQRFTDLMSRVDRW